MTAGVWTAFGPAPNGSGGGNVSGRITGIAADPTNNNNIYITAAGGGVWQTTNGGTSWNPLTDNQGALAMGAIAIAPTNHLKIYAGTGEANNSADSNFGLGILHSEDGGATWALSTGPSGVFNRLAIGKISVDPAVANTAYAAVNDFAENGLCCNNTGIYKTTDGGVTWTNVTLANGKDSATPWSDVVVDPNNSSIVYAAHGDIYGTAANGVYRSTDSGSTWTLLSSAPSGSGIGRIALAVAPSAIAAGAHVLYVAVVTQLSSGNGGLSGMYISSNADAASPTFSLLTNTPDFLGGGNGSGQGWYDVALVVDPTNAANVYAAGVVTYSSNSKHLIRSTNSGASWTDITVGANNVEPHTDSHALYVNSAGQILLGSDGGFWTYNPSDSNWTDLNGNLNTIQFTGIGLHPTSAAAAVGGSQDNGTEVYSGSTTWTETDGGDGGASQISQTNGNVIYGVHPIGSYGASSFMQVSTNGGASWASATPTITNSGLFNFYSPIFADPSNGNRIFLGGDKLYESITQGSSWTGHTSPDSSHAMDTIAVNPGSNTIYISTGGTFASTSSVWISTNDGATWAAINLPVGGRVNEIDVDPNDATGATAYAVINTFNGANGQVYKTVNSGASWTNISGNLPQVPTWSLKIDTDLNHTVYVSNETGVYSSKSPYTTWTAYGTGLSNAQGVSLQLNTTLHLLAEGTHGRGMWVTLTPSGPNMTITKSHTGDFVQGQTAASYSITATNAGALATSGVVTVTDTLPTGLTATAMAGAGWNCTLATLTCTRSDVLAANSSYPSIALTVNVGSNAPGSVTNIVNVSGGGEIYTGDDQASDITTILSSKPDMTIAKSHTGNFYPGQTGATYTITASNGGALPTTGLVTVTDTLPTGLTATAITGTGWSCTLATLTCTRSDALAAASSYPSITLTVNVAVNAPSLVTNTATVAGGGESNLANDTASDSTAIVNNAATSSISSIFPDTALAGGPDFTLTVLGSGFVSGAAILWNGSPLTTNYGYAGELTASVSASLIAAAGSVSITVQNPGEQSSTAAGFAIVTTPAVPVLSSAYASYSYYPTGGLFATEFLYLSGSGFESGMTLSWNGTNIGPVGIQFGAEAITVPSVLLQTPGLVTLTAMNPGGAASSSLTITVPPLRTLTSITPATVAAGSSGFTLTVNGTGFASGDYVNILPGTFGLATTFISSTQLQATVPASLVASNGTLQAWVDTSTTSGTFHSTDELPLTVGTGGPVLSISKMHSGNFIQGQQNATYTVTVSNASRAGATLGAASNQVIGVARNGSLVSATSPISSPSSGPVTVYEYVPSGLTLVSMAGSGWSCTLTSATCTRSDVLAGGASYPAITVTVNVSPAASSPVTNSVAVSGGGSSSAYTTDVTIVAPAAPDMTVTKSHLGNFVQGQTGAVYTITAVNIGGVATTAAVTVTDTLPSGLTPTAISGTGWGCTLATLTCARSDALAGGSSYPPITLTVNVAANAAPSVTNIANVSGGGETNAANDQATDVTMIAAAVLPTLSSTFPDSAVTGGSAFTLTLHGSNFVSGAVVNWGTTALVTTFSNSTLLTASVPAALIAGVGTASITVVNPGGSASSPLTFNIVNTPAVPTLTSAFPDYSWNGAGLFAGDFLEVSGSGFELGMTISWNGTNLGAFDGSWDGFAVSVPFSLMWTPGPVVITATNPGGAASNPLDFTVPSLRTLTSLSPATVPAGDGNFTLTVNGTGFASGDAISVWPGSYYLTTTFISSTQLQATVPASTVASNGTLQVWVQDNSSTCCFTSTNELPLTVGTGGPVLSITKSHTGNFYQGQQNAAYAVVVSNASGAGATLGTGGGQLFGGGPNGPLSARNTQVASPSGGAVTMNEYVPAGLTLVSMAGSGWTCTLSSATCTRSDVLAGGASYPAITVTVNVSPTAGSPLTNEVTVSGGGSVNNTANDVTIIALDSPDLTITKTHTGTFALGQIGATYTITAFNVGALATIGAVTVSDNIPAGLTATAISGAGWNCTLATVTCTRSDALASGASYPPITLTVNVAANAPASVTNIANVSGGGETNVSNDRASDVTAITGGVTISSLFPDTATAGGSAFTLAVSSSNSSFVSGAVINWNGAPLTTTYDGASYLYTTVPASLIATAGTASITVTNPGGSPSNALSFHIVTTPPTPTLTSAYATFGLYSTGLLYRGYLFVYGSGFEPGVTVSWNGVNLGTSTVELLIPVPTSLLQTPGPVAITAQNPGGAASAPLTITVPPLRTLTSISPTTVASGSGSITLTVNGTGFTSGDYIDFYPSSSVGATTFISSTQLQTTVAASDLTANNTIQVWVITSTSSGAFASTNELPLTVGTGGPVLSITKSHTGNFSQGQQNATYTVTVSNASGAGATVGTGSNQISVVGPNGTLMAISAQAPSPSSGPVTVNEFVPSGLTLVSMAGNGWTCTLSSASCTRSDVLAGGASYPPITVTVNVSPTAGSPLTNSVEVSGGGSPGGYSSDITIVTPVAAQPSISEMFPDTAAAGSSAFTLYVNGSNFVSGATVNWNGAPLTTTFSYSGLLYASVPAALVASAGTASVTVTNPGGSPSSAATFHIVTTPPVPTLTSAYATYSWYSATGIFAGDFLELSGSNFELGSTISWNGINLGAVNDFSVSVPSSLVQTPGPVSIVATNPGGAPSSPLTLTVPPLRTLTSIAPSSVAAGSGNFTLTVNGTGFASGDQITVWPGSFSLPTTFINSTELQATVPASTVASNATLQVWVNLSSTTCCFTSTNELPLTVGTGGPVLSITKSHSGNFYQGEQNATYTVTVSNASGAGATLGGPSSQIMSAGPNGLAVATTAQAPSPSSGAVTVTEDVPTGLTLVSMAGSGWTCTLSSATCTRSDVLAGGASYPAITVTVNVSATASSPVTNSVFVSGGGAPVGDTASDLTTITPQAALTAIFPDTALAGGPAFTLSVSGSNFAPGAVVSWNGSPLTTTYENAGSVIASVPAALIAATGTVSITVTLPGGLPSNSATFHIASSPAVPVLSGSFLTYSVWVTTGLFAEDLYGVGGSGFQQGVTLSWNGVNLGTFAGSGGFVEVPFNLVRTPGPVRVTAMNPGGAASAPVTFVVPPLRTLTSISPSSVAAGSGSFTLTVNGTGFAAGDAIAIWPSNFGLATTFVSPTELQATIPAAQVAANGTFQVWVSTYVQPNIYPSVNQLPMTVGTGGPELGITKTHAGNFYQGQQNATYTITVSNASGAGATLGSAGSQIAIASANGLAGVVNAQSPSPSSGAVTVTDSLPPGMTLVSMAGSGWTCTLSSASCTRSDVLSGGASYPAITVTVNVSATAGSPLTNVASVSGGGSPNSTAFDPTVIGPASQNETFMTSPEGLLVSVDGAAARVAPFTIALAPGSHTVAVATTQAGGAGVQYVFTSWSDSGAASHTITVGASPATYTAAFKTQYQLTTAASPAAGGTVTPASGIFYDSGSVVSAHATANAGYQFANFSGALAGSVDPQNVTMSAPANVVGNFTALAPNLAASVGARIVAGSTVQATITLTNTGLGAANNATITGISAISDVAGSGAVTVASGTPVNLGTINPGSSGTATITFNWPSTATRVSFTVNFTADGGYVGSTRITTLY